MIRKAPLLVLFLFYGFYVSAQTNFKSSYVVSLSGDTIKGFIDYREWYDNDFEITFKTALSHSNVTVYKPQNIKSFSVIGFEMYEAYQIKISQNEVNYRRVTGEIDTTHITGFRFLTPLLKGDQVSLYRYRDKLKERFYILEAGLAAPVELKYAIKVREGAVEEITEYRQQLNALALRAKKYTLSQKIQTVRYNKSHLIALVKEFNTHNFQEFSPNLTSKAKASIVAGVHLNYGTLQYAGENFITVNRVDANGQNKFEDQVVTHFYVPKLAAGIEFAINPALQHLVLRTELGATILKSETVSYYRYNGFNDKEQENRYKMQVLNITLTPQVIYHLYNQGHFKFFIGGGIPILYFNTRKSELTFRPTDPADNSTYPAQQDYLKLRPLNLSVLVRSGVVFHDTFEIGFSYIKPTELSNYSSSKGSSVKLKNLFLEFNYKFKK